MTVSILKMGNTWYKVRRQLLILFSMLVNFIIISLSLISIFFWLPVRLIVNFLAKVRRPDLGKPLTGPSSILVGKYATSKPRNYCGGYVLEGDFNLEGSLKLFVERVIEKTKKPNGELVYGELRQYWTSFFNYYFWKTDAEFTVSNHVRRYDYEGDLQLPEPCTEEDFRRVLGGLLSKDWPEKRSPWEILIVENFISESPRRIRERQTLVIFRVHHGLGDGYSFLNVFMQDLAQYEGNIARPSSVKLTRFQRLIAMVISPVKLLYDLSELCVDATDFQNCWRVKRGGRLSRRYYTSISKPLEVTRIREVKNNFGVNYVSVLLAALTGAIRRIMEDADQVVPKRLAVALPMPLPNHPGGLVNHVSAFAMKLPTRTVDPLKRLQEIFRATSKSKYYMAPLATYLSMHLNYVNTNWLNSTITNNSVGFTIAVSSFPGPEQELELLGCRLIDTMFGLGKIPGSSAGTVALVTGAGTQRFVMNIDQAVFPSEDIFKKVATYFEDEIELLHEKSTLMKQKLEGV